jgi:hypothetical protein
VVVGDEQRHPTERSLVATIVSSLRATAMFSRECAGGD